MTDSTLCTIEHSKNRRYASRFSVFSTFLTSADKTCSAVTLNF